MRAARTPFENQPYAHIYYTHTHRRKRGDEGVRDFPPDELIVLRALLQKPKKILKSQYPRIISTMQNPNILTF